MMKPDAPSATCGAPVGGRAGGQGVGRRGARPTLGFTLLEVLLAVSIFAMVLVAIHLVFYGAVRLRNQMVTEIEASLPLQQTCTLLHRDLANIVLPGTTLFGPLQSTANTSQQTGQMGQAPLATQAGDLPGQSSPEFYTTTATIDDNLPWGEVQRVSYFLADSTNGTVGRDLIRSVTRNLLPTAVEEQPDEQWLMSGVESIFFYYYDGQQWADTWDSTTQSNQLPQAIKVDLRLASTNSFLGSGPSARAPVQLIVPILPRASTNATQSTGGAQS